MMNCICLPKQINILAEEGVDTISAYTLTYPDEAIGIVRQVVMEVLSTDHYCTY